MTRIFLILLVSIFAGCVTTKAVVPALQGKPLIKINEQAQTPDAPEPMDTGTATPTAPAPDNKDTKESNKHVRKKTKSGNTNR